MLDKSTVFDSNNSLRGIFSSSTVTQTVQRSTVEMTPGDDRSLQTKNAPSLIPAGTWYGESPEKDNQSESFIISGPLAMLSVLFLLRACDHWGKPFKVMASSTCDLMRSDSYIRVIPAVCLG
jgi:hypothetical protein